MAERAGARSQLIIPGPHSVPQPGAWLLALCASWLEPPTGVTAVAGPVVPTLPGGPQVLSIPGQCLLGAGLAVCGPHANLVQMPTLYPADSSQSGGVKLPQTGHSHCNLWMKRKREGKPGRVNSFPRGKAVKSKNGGRNGTASSAKGRCAGWEKPRLEKGRSLSCFSLGASGGVLEPA